MKTHTYNKKIIISAAIFLISAVSALNAGVFGFEDVSPMSGTSTSEYLPYDYSGQNPVNGAVKSSSDGYTLSGGYQAFYDPDTWAYFGGGSNVFNSTSNTLGANIYDYDANTASGGAAGGSNYLTMFISSSDIFYSGQKAADYNGVTGYSNAYSSWLTGKNSVFDNTFSQDLDDADLDGNVKDYLKNCSLVLDTGKVFFTSVDLSLTALLYQKLDDTGKNDSYMGKTNIHTKTDGLYTVRIYGVLDMDSGLLTDTYVDWVAAKYIDGVNDILTYDWTTVNLTGLYGTDGSLYTDGLTGLAFQTISTFGSEGAGMGSPSYVAIDNVSYSTSNIPEPAEYAVVLGLSAAFLAYRRRKKSNK